MEETKESRNHNNKMVIKMGGGGGGGIGAVILLATAAFASAFLLGQKRRTSHKDDRSRKQEHISQVEKKEVEVEKDSTAHTLKMEKVGEVEDDGFVMVKEEIPETNKQESVSDDHSKESTDLEHVYIERERESDGHENVNMEEKEECCNGNGEINEEKSLEVPEATERALSGDEIVFSQDSVQMVVKTEQDQVEEKTSVIINGCILPLSPQNILTVVEEVTENEEAMQFDKEVEEELISPEQVEVVKYVANEQVPQNLKLHENEADSQPEENKDDVEREGEKEVEEEVVVDENDSATMSNMVNGQVSRKGGDEESNEVVEKKSLVHTPAAMNSVKTMDFNENSKWEAQWQGEWPKVSSKDPKQTKRMSYEVGGKIQEDYSAKDQVTVKDHPSNSTRWRMMIWTLSVITSLSCSWFFDLSPAKLCLVVFLTVFMLEIYGYPLLNRKQAQCLHAAKGDGIYEQRSSKK